MLFESLETRSLLTATLDAGTGVLTINGTDNNDHIVVFQDSKTTLTVAESSRVPPATPGGKPTVTHNKTTFNLADVKSIVVNAGKGNDSVNTGGSRKHALAIASTIDGGDGRDELIGGNANDLINGGAGNDRLAGRNGDDKLNGGDNNDILVGGKGADSMNGDAGNDLIDARDRAATDVIDGGTNDTPTKKHPGDLAIVDKGDTVTNVEKVRTIELT